MRQSECANPTWWSQENETAWNRVKMAMKRDWDQTKHDLGANQPAPIKRLATLPGRPAARKPFRRAVNLRMKSWSLCIALATARIQDMTMNSPNGMMNWRVASKENGKSSRHHGDKRGCRIARRSVTGGNMA